MADDDGDDQGELGPEELFAPTGARRSNFTPPKNDAETLEAAASVFNDDAIAAALSAELAKVASGPISVIRPEAIVTPQRFDLPAEPVAPAAAPPPVPSVAEAAPAPVPVPAVEPVPAPAAEPVFEAAPPPAPTPAPVAPPVAEPVKPPEPAFSWTPASEFVPTSVPAPPAYPTQPAPAEPQQQAPEPWPPAPEASAAPIDQPPPYLGAPAPTVPAADVPPPPGYEAPSVPSVPDELRPQRQSLDDADLLRSIGDDDGAADGTLGAIAQLQAQLELRAQEAQAYSNWEQSMIALGTPDSLAAVDRARAEQAGRVPSVPEPAEPAEPAAAAAEPATSFAPEPVVAEPVAAEPFVPQPIAPEPSAPPIEEPSLEGTAFAELFAASRTEAPPAPPVQASPPAPESAPFAGIAPPTDGPFAPFVAPSAPDKLQFDPPAEPAAPAAPTEPAAPAGPPPPAEGDAPFAGLQPPAAPSQPDDPVFIEPPALVEPPPPQPGPSGDFESLLEVDEAAEKPDAQPSTWLAPPPNGFTEPDIDAATGERRPFGEGVERDEAVDPSDSIFGSTLSAASGVVSVNTLGVAIVGAPVAVVSQSIPIQRVEPLPPETVLQRQRIFAPEAAGAEPTALEYRVGRAARLFWLWFASNSSIVAVVFGGMILALGMSLRQAIVATLAGIAVSFIPLGLGTLAGKRSGQPTMVVSRATFGVVGNILPAAIALLSRLFWAAALLWLFGAGLASILVPAKLTDGFTQSQLTMIVMVIGFVLAIVIAYFGYSLIAQVQLVVSIVSGIFIVGFIALTFQYVNVQTALTIGDGNWILAITGAVLVFSFVGLVWANSSGDLARYQRVGSSGATSMLWATFGTALPSFVLIAYGSVLAASDPRITAGLATNPLDTLGRLLPNWYPAPLLLGAGLSLLSGAVLAIYSGGFALQAIGLRVRRSGSTIIVGALVLVVAVILTVSITDFTELFRDFATTVAVPVAAWAGMFAAEMMIRNRRFDSVSLRTRGGVYADVRWPNLIAFVVISVAGLGLTSASIPWLTWEGFLFPLVGVPRDGILAGADVGVFVALLVGLIFPIVAGVPAIRKQERAERPAE